MTALSRLSPPFQLGAWRVDPATGQLTRGEDVRRARALVADVLLYLAARPGEVVTKDELVAGPWGGAAIADSALTSTIAELRELLDDQAKSPQYIQTLPKRGYRLIASVGPLATPLETAEQPAPIVEPPVAPVGPPVEPPVEPPVGPMRATAAVAPGEPTVVHPRWSHRSWAVAFGLGATFALAVGISIASRRQSAGVVAPPPPVRAMRLTVDLPPGVRLAPENLPRLALAPDGSRMAYVVRTSAGRELYTRTLEQFDARLVTGATDASAPFFSPDGARLGYFSLGELRTISVSGGEPAIVCQARVALGGSWGADDTIVFSGSHGHGLFEVPAAGGAPRKLTDLDFSRGELSHRWPQVLPDGSRVLFTAIGQTRADVLVLSRATGERRVVVDGAQAGVFVPPNRLLFERGGRVLVATIDPDRFELTGPPRVLLEDATQPGPGTGSPSFAVASGGVLVYAPVDPHDTERELVWVDRAGAVSPVGAPPRSYMHPRLSPDGRQILTWLRTHDPDLWLVDVASGAMSRLVTGIAARRAIWSPDGLRLLFDGPGPDNPVTLYEADVRGGEPRRLRFDGRSQYVGAWTPVGTIAYDDLTRETGFDIDTMAPEPHAAAVPLVRGPANDTAPAFSPDGRWLAFVSDVTGREEVYVLPFPRHGAGAPLQISTSGGREPVWSKDGDELFFRQGQSVWGVQVSGATGPRVSAPVALFKGEFDQRPIFLPNYDVAADGRFLMIRGIAPPTTDTRIAVLLRWDQP